MRVFLGYCACVVTLCAIAWVGTSIESNHQARIAVTKQELGELAPTEFGTDFDDMVTVLRALKAIRDEDRDHAKAILERLDRIEKVVVGREER